MRFAIGANVMMGGLTALSFPDRIHRSIQKAVSIVNDFKSPVNKGETMILDMIIVPGIDPPDVLRKTMNHSIGVAIIPATIFLVSEALSGNFSGYQWNEFGTKEAAVLLLSMFCFISQIPLGFWIDFVGTQKLKDYLVRNSQILERQLMGAMARLFRTSQLCRIHLVAVGTLIGLVDAILARSLLGLAVYLIGQVLLFYLLPWPFRWEIWQSIRRKLILD